jgi:hypothetical protein
MSWEVGGPTDKSGAAYRASSKRQFLKYVGAATVGFGGGAVSSNGGSTEGIVSAFGGANETADEDPSPATANGSATPAVESSIAGTEPSIDEVVSVEASDGQRKFVLVTVALTNPREESVRRGVYATIRDEPYESSGDRVVELPPTSRHEYLVRIPRIGQLRSALVTAVQTDDYDIETSVGLIPERYRDA